MKLEVLLSVLNLSIKDLDKMNIKSSCTVINQCNKNDYRKYKNFNIYSYKEKGLSKSRNRGLEHVREDIIILCDDDVVYNDNYDKIILNEFKKNKKADIIIFNIDSPNRKIKINKRNKRLHFYNILRYSSPRIAFRRKSVKNISFNELFGSGSRYSSGEEALFLVDCLKKHLNIYASTSNIGIVNHNTSNWFNGYDRKFFFDKGALFTAINPKIRHFLIIQYILRHKEVLKKIKRKDAYRYMIVGSKDYLKGVSYE